MLKLTQRKDSSLWWVTGTINGQRIRQSTGTTDEAAAAEYKANLEVGIWRQARLGEKPKMYWQSAVVRWIKEKRRDGKDLENDLCNLRWLDPKLKDKTLDEIDNHCIAQLIDDKSAEGTTNATINRMLAMVRAILRKAEREWGTLDKAPTIKPLVEANQRIRWLTYEEAKRLLLELPVHLSDMAEFTLATGLRASNVTGLEWSQIDLSRRVAWIHPDQAKAGKAIPVPLNDVAIGVLKRRIGSHPSRVFTYEGRPIIQHNTKAWTKALQRAGITNFRWHDLRHTWASWHVQNGTPLEKLQQLGGWGSFEMVLRYAHLAPEHLADAANNIGTILTRSENELVLKAA